MVQFETYIKYCLTHLVDADMITILYSLIWLPYHYNNFRSLKNLEFSHIIV